MKAMISYSDFTRNMEREYILNLLHTTRGNVASASRVGEIPLTALKALIKAHDIDVNLFRILDRSAWAKGKGGTYAQV